jgi:hypothetical protein
MSKGDVTIPLSEPITVPGEATAVQVDKIVLRQPKYLDIMELGQPSAFARDIAGMIYTAEKDETIKAYIERLLVEPKNPMALVQLGTVDTLKLRDAVFGFFATSPTT